MRRVALVCPGRGTYTRSELGILTRADRPDPSGLRGDMVARADRWRSHIGRTSISELDGADRFGAVHLKGENAAALIYTSGALDAASLAEDLEAHQTDRKMEQR